MSKSKGSRWERHYRNAFNAETDEDDPDVERVGTSLLWVDNFFAMRAPSSGSGTADALPDLHIWYNDPDDPEEGPKQFAAETKAGSGSVHFDKIDDLDEYCGLTGAVPIAIVHLDYVGDFVIHKDDLHETGAGNHTFTEARDADDARTFDDFVRSPTTI